MRRVIELESNTEKMQGEKRAKGNQEWRHSRFKNRIKSGEGLIERKKGEKEGKNSNKKHKSKRTKKEVESLIGKMGVKVEIEEIRKIEKEVEGG